MKSTMTAIALALGVAGFAAPAQAATSAQEAAQAAEAKQITLSRGASKAIGELQAAFNAKDWATFDALLGPAGEKAENPDDFYFIGNLLLNAGLQREDMAMQVRGVDTMAASGWADVATTSQQYQALGRNYYAADDYTNALALFEKAAELTPNDPQVYLLKGEALANLDRGSEAVAMMQRGIELQQASGNAVEENWYRRAIQIAVGAEGANVSPLTIAWVKAYPTQQNWRDTLRLYEQDLDWSDADLVDLWRLMRAADALQGDRDHFTYARVLLDQGYPNEAKRLVEEAISAQRIDGNSDTFSEIVSLAQRQAAEDAGSLDSDAASARSSNAMRAAMSVGDLYYGDDQFGKAAEFYQLALGREGADADLLNLRLGAALARDGQFDAANAALGQVSGKYADLAGFWMAWVDVQS